MYTLEEKTIINAPIEKVWDFFSSPHNLNKISPTYMDFTIKSGGGAKMYAGQIIAYRVKPLLGIPLTWVTEITHVADKKFFVDEQRIGPYSMWHHEHHFKETADGVEMTDIVSYHLPLGLLGRVAHRAFVRNQLKKIFQYRASVMDQFFEKS
jgi:ligand-binding SRPBCC domain-containing protein